MTFKNKAEYLFFTYHDGEVASTATITNNILKSFSCEFWLLKYLHEHIKIVNQVGPVTLCTFIPSLSATDKKPLSLADTQTSTKSLCFAASISSSEKSSSKGR